MPEDHAANDTMHVPFRGVDQDFFNDLYKTLESTNISFLLDAGRSMSAFRTLGDLEELRVKLDGEKNTLGKDREVIYRLIKAEIDRRFSVGSIYRNIEYVTGSKEDSKDDTQQIRAACKDLCTEAVQTVTNRESIDKPGQVMFFTSDYDSGMDLVLDEAKIPTNSAYLGRFSRIVGRQTFGNRVFSNGIGPGYRTEIPSTNLVRIHGRAPWHHGGDQLTIDDSYQILEKVRELSGVISRLGEYQPEIEPNTSGPSESRTTRTSTKISADFETLKIQAKTTFRLTRKHKHGKNNLVAKLDELDKARNKLAVVLPNKRKFTSAALNETYYDQLRRLSNQLEPSNTSLLVMGPSLANEHIRSLVVCVARANPTLKVIIFCYSGNIAMTIADYLGYFPKKYPNIELVVGPRFGQAFETEAKDHQRFDIHAVADIL